MTQPSPDGVTLDAMILGTDTDAERDAWRDLLASPDGATAWREALERRARIDAFARVIAHHPWLAEVSLKLRRAMRSLGRSAWPGAQVTTGSPLLATLAGGAAEGITLAQGETRTLEVPVGTEVRIVLPNGTSLQRVTPSGAEAYEHPGWLMERGDGLVVLVATQRDGGPVAALVLTEIESGENVG